MKIQKLLKTKRNWIKFRMGADKYGRYANPVGVSAAKWCLIGAIYKCYGIDDVRTTRIIKKVRKELNMRGGDGIDDWNDDPNRTFKDVRALVRKLNI